MADTNALKVLLADDEPEPLRATARLLRHMGYEVTTADDGQFALDAVDAKDVAFDIVVTDISMPRVTGIELLQQLRRRDGTLPVILVTGAPAVETAIQALDHGAYKYLVKPFDIDQLDQAIKKAVQLRRLSKLRQEAAKLLEPAIDVEGTDNDLSEAYSTMEVAFQPITTTEGKLYGYEVLMRPTHERLSNPLLVLDAANKLGRTAELSAVIRNLACAGFAAAPPEAQLFINLAPTDLELDEAWRSAPIRKIAHRTVLEVTERARVGSVQDLRNRLESLRGLGYRIAIDDLGAGYSGLNSFALLEPEVVKIDMALVRDVDKEPVKQRLISSMTRVCRESGITSIGEGIETVAERDWLIKLGVDLLQGFLLGKPGPPFPEIIWP